MQSKTLYKHSAILGREIIYFRRGSTLKILTICILLFGAIISLSACESQNNAAITATKKTMQAKMTPLKKKSSESPISKSTQQITISYMKQDHKVKDAGIEMKNSQISLVVILNAVFDEFSAELVGENFARKLAENSQVGEEPGTNDLGGLWDKYSLSVTVEGPSNNIIVKGTKFPSDSSILWG